METAEPQRHVVASERSGLRVALVAAARLTIALSLTWIAVVAVALSMGRREAMLPALIAAVLCGVGGVAGAVVGRQSPGRIETHWLHLAIGLRTGTPLFGLLCLHGLDRSLIDAGLPFYLLPFYCVTLVVETIATVRALRRMASPVVLPGAPRAL